MNDPLQNPAAAAFFAPAGMHASPELAPQPEPFSQPAAHGFGTAQPAANGFGTAQRLANAVEQPVQVAYEAVQPAPAAPAPVDYAAQRAPAAPGVVKMPDLGILNQLIADERVHDILVNGTKNIYVDMLGQLQDTGLKFNTNQEVNNIAERIMGAIGHKWDETRPIIDTRLPDGSRVNIVGMPMAVDGVSISIRKFPAHHITLDSMAERGTITREIAEFLKLCAARRLNVIVAGGTGSGKTTMLNALSAAISPKERIVTVEDSAELRLQQPHVVRLEAKPPASPEMPHTAVTIRDLVKNALRMRPDRILVGESRGAEAFDVLQAMNTGHDGSMTSLHANSPREAVTRLETMVSIAMPQLAIRMVRQQIAGTVHLMIQMARSKDGTRRITHIAEIAGMEGEVIVMQDLIVWQDGANGTPGQYKWVAGSPRNQQITDAARTVGMLKTFR